MSDISFRCPSCEGVLVVDEAGSGWEVDCPMCGVAVIIPAQGELAVPEVLEVRAPIEHEEPPPPIEAEHVDEDPPVKSEAVETPTVSAPPPMAPAPSTPPPKAKGTSYVRKQVGRELPPAQRPDDVDEADWNCAKEYIGGFAEQVFKRAMSDGECDQVAAVSFMTSLGAKLAKAERTTTAYGENNGNNRRLSRALILCKINPAPEVLG